MAKPVDDPTTTLVEDSQVSIEGEYLGPKIAYPISKNPYHLREARPGERVTLKP